MAAKIKSYKAKIEDLKDDGSYVAYVSTFGDVDNVDKDGDFFSDSAFDKTIKKRKGEFPGVWMHDVRRPVSLGQIQKDSKGLIVQAQINLEIKDGQETYSNMQKRIMGDHSIGFNVNWKKSEDLKDEDGRITGFGFHEVELLEYSALTMGFAANENANLIALKWRNASMGDDKEDDAVDSGIIVPAVDSAGDVKAMEALIADIKGLTLNVTQFCERS